jgi:protein tyrosine/serine phosphatase
LLIATCAVAPAGAQVTVQTGRSASAATATRAAATPAPRPGLPRFGTITTHLYRGGQPDDRGFAELKSMGIDVVVNLRHEENEIGRERALVEGLGLRYVSIPWRGKQEPNLAQMAEFLNLLRGNPDKRVFVHCERGSERTGVMIASYRMSAERWTPAEALAEMEAFGFRGLGFGHLKRFVREFPTLLMREPLFVKPILEVLPD